MNLLVLILLLIAAGCFAWATFARRQPRIGLVPLGLLAWVLTVIVGDLAGVDVNLD